MLFERRSSNGLWSNMWQVPTIESDRLLRPAEIRRRLDVPLDGLRKTASFEHQTTHRRIRFHVYAALARGESKTSKVRSKKKRGRDARCAMRDEGKKASRRRVWRRADDVDDLPMSNAQRRVLEIAISDKRSGREPLE